LKERRKRTKPPLAENRGLARTTRRRFELILIKPSHCDDDGHVIQWFRPKTVAIAVDFIAADAVGKRIAADPERSRMRTRR